MTTLIHMERRAGDAFNRAVAEQLHAAADRQGKSLRDLADATGISRPTLGRLLASGDVLRTSELRMAHVYALCQALQLDLVGVMARAEQRVADEVGDPDT